MPAAHLCRTGAGELSPTTTKAAVPTPSSTTVAHEAGAQLLALALRDGAQKRWAQIDSLLVAPGHRVAFTQVAGSTTGRQIVTVDGAHAEVIALVGKSYIKGDAAAVKNFFGFARPSPVDSPASGSPLFRRIRGMPP